MTFAALKRNVFILEGLNGFASSIYFNYLFFFLRDNFGFGAKGNLLFCAANGLIYAIGAFYGGKIAQRSGYFKTLKGGWTQRCRKRNLSPRNSSSWSAGRSVFVSRGPVLKR